MSNVKALPKEKGRLYVWDESSGVKDLVEISLVDSIEMAYPANPVKLKSPSGITVLSFIDMKARLTCDWYNPRDNAKLELLLRGAVTNTNYDGTTAQSETVRVRFRNTGEAFLLPGFNGDKTPVTISAVTLADDVSTTFTVATDYAVAVDADTGYSYISHVGAGDIPVDTDILVTYSYTPLASTMLKPVESGELAPRYFVIEILPDPTDPTKYIRYYLPNATIESDLVQRLLKVSTENQNLNVLNLVFAQDTQEEAQNYAPWSIVDTYNV
ncbi:MAG TPA: hypothetical protein VGN57_18995 [Pirellulaceae bacterium]|jgi:hypothetical protein|nr:hypothetical protein [Pirellulaceae bacterium]